MKKTSNILTALALTSVAAGPAPAPPHPAQNPESPLMLAGTCVPDDSKRIDFDKLPRVASQHAVMSSVNAPGSSPLELDHKNGGVNQHNYLAHHNGKFWGCGATGRASRIVRASVSNFPRAPMA